MNDRELIYVLLIGLVFFALVLIGVAVFIPNHAALYAAITGVMGNFSGALFMAIRQHVAAEPKV